MKLLALCLAVSTLSAATVYDLASDFSNSANPNTPWEFRKGSSLLTKYNPPYPAGCCTGGFQNSFGDGYWGVSAPLSDSGGGRYFPDTTVEKVTANGSATGTQNDNDFLTGDVIAHSTNPGNGDALYIDWIAPSAGQILSWTGSVWYAHSSVSRSNDFTLYFNGNALATGTVGAAQNRPNAVTFGGGPVSVMAGDVFSLMLAPSSAQQFGSLAGVQLTFDFAPAAAVPEPATWLLTGGAAASVAFLRRHRPSRRRQ